MAAERPVFSGGSGAECERFIREVRQAAFDQGKARDFDWQADFASTCLDGEALRWYETLDEDIQGDWKLLRKALLERYPNPSQSQEADEAPTPVSAFVPVPASASSFRVSHASSASSSGYLPSTTSTTQDFPAAAPPLAATAPTLALPTDQLADLNLSARTGRIRVILDSDPDPSNVKYIKISKKSGYYGWTTKLTDALRVKDNTPTSRPHALKLLDSLPNTRFEHLAIKWHQPVPNLRPGSTHNAVIIATDESQLNPSGAISLGHKGPVGSVIWKVSPTESLVIPTWTDTSGKTYDLTVAVYVEWKRLIVVPDWDAFIKVDPSRQYAKARLVFEALS